MTIGDLIWRVLVWLYVWIGAHRVLLALLCGWMFSAVVSQQPKPRPEDSAMYVWVYNTLHFVSANLDRMRGRPLA